MKKIILLLLALILLVSTVHAATPNWSTSIDVNTNKVTYNESYKMDNSGSTPWEIWWASGLIGLGLFLLSVRPRSSTMELEVDAIISAISLVPIAFCAWSSFNIDRLTGAGITSIAVPPSYVPEYVLMLNHTIYSFPIIGILMAAFFIASIGNLFRIMAQHKLFRIKTQDENKGVGKQ